jgi:hypothetical protein
LSAQEYIEGLLETAARAEDPAHRRMLAMAVDAIDRGSQTTYGKGVGDLTRRELACVLLELAGHIERLVPGLAGARWAARLRGDADDLAM